MTKDMDALRDEIDRINEDIVADVRERMDIVEAISEQKDAANMEVRDPEREAAVRDQFAELFTAEGLPPGHGRRLADVLIDLAVEVQRQ